MRAKYRTLDRLRQHGRRTSLFARLRSLRPLSSETPEYASELDTYLAGLDETSRRLVYLRFVEGRPVAELALRTGLSQKAVEHRLQRLRQRLANEIAEQEETSHVLASC